MPPKKLEEDRILPAPLTVDKSIVEQWMDAGGELPLNLSLAGEGKVLRKSPNIRNMLPTRRETLRKRPGYRYVSQEPEGVVFQGLFEFGAIAPGEGLVPVVLCIGHQKAYMISTTTLPPQGITAAAGDTQVTVSWTLYDDAVSYDIDYKLATANTWTSLTGVTGTSRRVTGLTNGQEYEFRVRSVLADATKSLWSVIVKATPVAPVQIPAVPTGLTAVAGETEVTFSWTAVPGAETYDLRYRVKGVNAWTNDNAIRVATRKVTGLTADTTYEWQLRAWNTAGLSAYTSTHEVKTLAIPSIFLLERVSNPPVVQGFVPSWVLGRLWGEVYVSRDRGATWPTTAIASELFLGAAATTYYGNVIVPAGLAVGSDGQWWGNHYHGFSDRWLTAIDRSVEGASEMKEVSGATAPVEVPASSFSIIQSWMLTRPTFDVNGQVWGFLYNGNLYKSTNGGSTWSAATVPAGFGRGVFRINKSNNKWFILEEARAGTDDALLWESSDQGSTWTKRLTWSDSTNIPGEPVFMVISPQGKFYLQANGNNLSKVVTYPGTGNLVSPAGPPFSGFSAAPLNFWLDGRIASWYFHATIRFDGQVHSLRGTGPTGRNSFLIWNSAATRWSLPMGFASDGNDLYAIAQETSGNPAKNKIFKNSLGFESEKVVNHTTYWPGGTNGPATFGQIRIGIAVDDDGNQYQADASKFYKRTGTTWDTGTSLPFSRHPANIWVDGEGRKFYVADDQTRKIYKYESSAWDTGAIPYPTGVNTCGGFCFDPGNGNLYFVPRTGTSKKIYTRTGTSWNSGTALPSGLGEIRGLATSRVLK